MPDWSIITYWTANSFYKIKSRRLPIPYSRSLLSGRRAVLFVNAIKIFIISICFLQMRISGTATRRKLFDVEHGVCQLCHYDAHACYNNVKVLQKKDRRGFLEKTIYADLPPRLLNRMILDPKEGMVSLTVDIVNLLLFALFILDFLCSPIMHFTQTID